ncbi:PIN domain-containing protein [Dyadobacter sp. LJ53]|uniref:PIN domain-containing protein n=1 Tax=Dyadobacter chenwenxiniae TaxID=2906456 RepID=UPI001F3DFCF5|nr:PIN domain-containing protein [Dyadobacter chenwenxiniae]MCF0054076.1 PIN domain-containing protein [Dyadobacter chenwenxiniae]
MIVVVDTNILFSACISPNNRISEILFSPLPNIQRISCYYAMAELFKHQSKIVQLSRQPVEAVSTLLYTVMKQVDFLNEKMIENEYFHEADRLTAGVDSNDIAFVALSLQKNGTLWTGDKKLTSHLKSLGFNRVIATNDLYEMLGIGK